MNLIAAIILAATVVFAPSASTVADFDNLTVERAASVSVKPVTVGGSAGFSL